jgi:hypothetical protein
MPSLRTDKTQRAFRVRDRCTEHQISFDYNAISSRALILKMLINRFRYSNETTADRYESCLRSESSSR